MVGVSPCLANVLYAFEQSDVAGKVIVVLLVVGSVFSWSVMITKFRFIRRARLENQIFLKRFRASKHPLAIYAKEMRFSASPLAGVYDSGARELAFHVLGSSEVDETFVARLQDAEPLDAASMASVRARMEGAVGEQVLKLESQLILLATAVSGAPFLGLLGTVWGVMGAFTSVAMAGNAQLSTLAPGVSAALLTTVVGLLVAIPAMFGYNFLVNTIRSMTVEMENFSAECASVFEHEFMESR